MTTFRKRILLALSLGLALWVLFFDSHAVIDRVSWNQELHALQEENAQLEADIQALHDKLAALHSDEVIEHIAREHYGMRRKGETVYPLATP